MDKPKMSSVEWTDFIVSKLLPEELFDGFITVEGLRRVTEEYVGDVVESISIVAQSPNASNNNHSACVHKLTVAGYDGVVRKASGAADVFEGNGDDANFTWKYSLATCETRAESRAYRRLLKLRGVCAAEEISQVPSTESGMDGYATSRQINYMNILCQRNDINVVSYLNSGKQKFRSVEQIPYTTAVKISSHLALLERKQDEIKPEWKGYKADWQKNFS